MKISQPEGYLAVPSSGAGAGVLVLHAWWGLNDTFRGVCDRLAREGYTAFAPDLYHGKVAKTIPEAETLGKQVDGNFAQTRAEIAEAAAYLSDRVGAAGHGIAVIGFSMGVYYSLDLADSHPELINSVVIYYGTGDGEYRNSRAAYLGHFAEKEQFEPQWAIEKLEDNLRRAGREVSFHTYPGTSHWFFEPDVTQAYDQAAAQLSWERTLEFLKRRSPV